MHTHFHTTPTPALSSPRPIMRISSPMSGAQSGTDQTGNGFIVQHVALSFVWRDPAVVSDGMWVNPDWYLQRVKAHIKSLVTFVVVPCRVWSNLLALWECARRFWLHTCDHCDHCQLIIVRKLTLWWSYVFLLATCLFVGHTLTLIGSTWHHICVH